MKQLKLTSLIVMMFVALLVSCNKGSAVSDSSSKEERKNEITIGLSNDLDNNLDPHKTTKAGTREVMFNIFEGLMKPLPNGDLKPCLADSYTISDDGLTYIFTLKENVLFHNGKVVTVDDVLYSFDRCINPTDALIRPYDELKVIKSITSPKANTIVFTLSSKDVDFLNALTLPIIPHDYDNLDTMPIGTGPFKFVSREAQNTVILERFNDYHGTPAHLDKVTLKIMENVDSLVLSLQSKAIDLCNHLPTEQAIQLKDDFDIVEGSMSVVQALYLNNAIEPFNDIRVRKALCYAIDRKQILDIAFDGYGTLVGSSMYPSLGKYFDDSLSNIYEYDVDKAKALLTEAGYPNGFNMVITVPSNYSQHVATAEVISEQLKKVGINAELKLVEWNTWVSDAYVGRNYETTVVGLDASTMTARAMLNRFVTDNRKNFVNFSSGDFDNYFNKAINAIDDATQVEMYKKAEKVLAEEACNVYIQAPADLVAMRKGLKGMEFYPLYVLDLAPLYWDD